MAQVQQFSTSLRSVAALKQLNKIDYIFYMI